MSSSDSSASVAVVSHDSHVAVRGALERTLLLLLLSGRSITSTASSGGGTTSSSRSSRATRTNVQEEILDILALERLREEGSPDGLDIGDTSGLDQAVKLVGLYYCGQFPFRNPVSFPACFAMCAYRDLNAFVGKDKGGVGRGELGGRHFSGRGC